MSQVSKYKLNNKIYEKIFSLFPRFLYKMTSKGKQAELVNAFFTRTEQIIFAKRIAIAFMLVKGYSYRQITDKIKVSSGTVFKIADSIKRNQNTVTEELELIAAEDAFVDFINAVGYQISKALPPKGGNWSVWRGRMEQEREKPENPI